MENLTPVTRIEHFLQQIIDNGGGAAAAPAGGGVLMVNADGNGTLDKTWKELNDAGFSVLRGANNLYYCAAVVAVNASNFIAAYYDPMTNTTDVFSTNAETGYPAYDDGGGGTPIT